MKSTWYRAAHLVVVMVSTSLAGCSRSPSDQAGRVSGANGSGDPLTLTCTPNGDSGAGEPRDGGSQVCPPNAACLTCESEQCPDVIAGCDAFDAASRRACLALLRCVRETSCHATNLIDCYCGTANEAQCVATTGEVANGACKAEIEAAQGTTDPVSIQNQFTDVSTPGGAALYLSLCDRSACKAECIPYGPVCATGGDDAATDAGGSDEGHVATDAGSESGVSLVDGALAQSDGEAGACTRDAACRACETEQCPDYIDACAAFEDADKANCLAVKACVRDTLCHASSLLDCYCGTAGEAQCVATGGANGACKTQIEAAQRTTDPVAIQNQLTDVSTPGGAALFLMLCDTVACHEACLASGSPCPN